MVTCVNVRGVATSYPSAEEFEALLTTQPLDAILADHVLSGVPYAFRADPLAESLLKKHLCGELKLDPANIRVVGSARTGFSLNPHTFPRSFGPASDLDIIVVDQQLFDMVWRTMLEWNYPRRVALPTDERKWRNARQNDLYWGWFRPDRLRYDGLQFPEVLTPLRDLSAKWFNAFRSLSTLNEFSDRDAAGRLYRSWTHALLYHLDGLRQLRDLVKV